MIYVGTVHIDFKGAERLRKVIRKYKPEVLTIEIPDNLTLKTAVEMLRKNKASLLDALEKARSLDKDLRSFFREYFSVDGFEVEVVYALSSHLRVEPIDSPEVLRHEDEIGDFDISKVRKMMRVHDQTVQRVYDGEDVISEMIGASGSFLDDPEFVERREEYMAENIRRIRPDMHIGGIEHLLGLTNGLKVDTLWKRCSRPGDQIVRLCDADKIKSEGIA